MDIGRFLCREEAERRRITDVGRELRPGVPFLVAGFLIAGVAGVGAYGWAPLVPPVVAIAVYAVTWSLNMPRRARPEYAYAAAFVFAELMLALAIVVGRAPRTPFLILLAMPVLFVAVLFPRRAVVAAAAFAAVLMLVVALTVGWPEVSRVPAVAYTPVFVVISLVFTALALRDLDDASRRSAFIDELTRALNRSALSSRLAEITHQAAETGKPVALVVGDIDHFKLVNDEHGHVTGDLVLREVVRRLSDCVGAFDPVYRLGGEEFLVLLPGLHMAAAEEVGLAMWQAVRESPIEGVRVTMSFGVASTGADEAFDFDALFTRADRALYQAKQGGRDWVRAAPETGEAAPAGSPPRRAVEPIVARRVTSSQVPAGQAHLAAEPLGWLQTSSALGTPGTSSGRVTDDLEREHTLDLNRRLAVVFRIIAGGAFVMIASGVPEFGWETLLPPVVGAIPYYLISRHADRFINPGRVLGLGWTLFQASIAAGFLCSRGDPLFAISLMILMVPGRCGVLRPRQAAAATAYTALLMVLVAFDLDAGAVADNPSLVLFPLALLAEAAYVGSIVGRSAVGHRGAGIVDELTGLLNRTALRARLLELDAQSSSIPPRVGMLLIDIDRFKEINDRSGHAAGDVVLREAGARIRDALRTYESAYRVGGEEVLVLLPHADKSSATDVAERLRESVAGDPCAGQRVTISVGVGVTAPGERFNYRDVFQRADTALYEAKRLGRDRVCTSSSDPITAPAEGVDAGDGLLAAAGHVA
jgi:diguanylate cyclase (GGDEF)-like protein